MVNCSLFNPTPSLSAMIINHFKMRSDIDSFNLGEGDRPPGSPCRRSLAVFRANVWAEAEVCSARLHPAELAALLAPGGPVPSAGGMGCSAGMISIDLAKKMLRVRAGRGARLEEGNCKPASQLHRAQLVLSFKPVAAGWPACLLGRTVPQLAPTPLPTCPLQERGRGGYALVVSTENITQNWCGRTWAGAGAVDRVRGTGSAHTDRSGTGSTDKRGVEASQMFC